MSSAAPVAYTEIELALTGGSLKRLRVHRTHATRYSLMTRWPLVGDCEIDCTTGVLWVVNALGGRRTETRWRANVTNAQLIYRAMRAQKL